MCRHRRYRQYRKLPLFPTFSLSASLLFLNGLKKIERSLIFFPYCPLKILTKIQERQPKEELPTVHKNSLLGEEAIRMQVILKHLFLLKRSMMVRFLIKHCNFCLHRWRRVFTFRKVRVLIFSPIFYCSC